MRQALDAEAGQCDQCVDWTIEVTPTGNRPPRAIEPVLPARDPWFRRATMLDEQQRAAGFQHAPGLVQRLHGVRNGAKCPGGHNRVDACRFKGQTFCRSREQFDRYDSICSPILCHAQQGAGGFNARDRGHTISVEGQVEARANAEFEHMTPCLVDDALAHRHKRFLPHREM